MIESLTARHLGKTFPGVVALDDVSLTVRAGTIHALVGANGAGKSTLIKILTGYYDEYAGSIEMDGTPVQFHKPADALAHGIEVVHQEVDTTLIPYLTVAENLAIEQLAEKSRSPFVNWRALYAQAGQAATRVGLTVNVRREVQDLTLHEKQLLVIARALSRQVKYLILDEPTAALGLREVDKLFEVLRELKHRGVGIIYISHRLNEVNTLADEITVLRNGRVAAHFPTRVEPGEVVEAMLGSQIGELVPPRPSRTPGTVILQARGLSYKGRVKDVSLTVRQGEILGIVGLVGAGKTELLRLLFGADRPDSGTLELDGKPIELRQPSDAVRVGILLVPEERRAQGLDVQEPVRVNVTLPYLKSLSWLGWVIRRRELTHTHQVIRRVGLVPPNPEMLAKNLSGGNQQKVVIGKWLGGSARVMLFDEATQGIDIQAKREVYALAQSISEYAGVVFASADVDEVLALADRLVILRDGQVVTELDAADTNRQTILEWATGARQTAGQPA